MFDSGLILKGLNTIWHDYDSTHPLSSILILVRLLIAWRSSQLREYVMRVVALQVVEEHWYLGFIWHNMHLLCAGPRYALITWQWFRTLSSLSGLSQIQHFVAASNSASCMSLMIIAAGFWGRRISSPPLLREQAGSAALHLPLYTRIGWSLHRLTYQMNWPSTVLHFAWAPIIINNTIPCCWRCHSAHACRSPNDSLLVAISLAATLLAPPPICCTLPPHRLFPRFDAHTCLLPATLLALPLSRLGPRQLSPHTSYQI